MFEDCQWSLAFSIYSYSLAKACEVRWSLERSLTLPICEFDSYRSIKPRKSSLTCFKDVLFSFLEFCLKAVSFRPKLTTGIFKCFLFLSTSGISNVFIGKIAS